MGSQGFFKVFLDSLRITSFVSPSKREFDKPQVYQICFIQTKSKILHRHMRLIPPTKVHSHQSDIIKVANFDKLAHIKKTSLLRLSIVI